jgi:hypothetical protein
MCNLKATNYKQKFRSSQEEFFAYARFPLTVLKSNLKEIAK